jgi:large repetitive protein
MWKFIRRKKSPRPSQRPCIEFLEDRCVPTTAIAEFPLLTAGSSPAGITMGPDGNLWFTETQANQIGMIDPTTHAIAEFPIPTANSGPIGITTGPDGNLWFTEANANKIAAINPTTHTVTEFALPTAGSQPVGIATGADGTLWFTEVAGNQVGTINPTTHAVTEFPLPTASSSPIGITAGPDGNLWFTENTHNRIASINPVTHIITEYVAPSANSQPYGITPGPDGNIWFTENNTNRVAKINPTSHSIIEFAIATANSHPTSVAAGPDGNIWFVESAKNKIGSLALSNSVVTETNLPTAAAAPVGIAGMPGGAVWFTESSGNQIGEVIGPPVLTYTPTNQTAVAGQTVTFFAASAFGLPPPTVQWQVSTDGGVTFAPIVNGGVYSGATTGTLTISGVTTAMTGYRYEAVFSNNVTPAVTTPPATLTVNNVLSISPSQLPQGTPGSAYNQTISIVGSTTPFTLFSVNNFNAGGTGLSLANVTTNSVNGTITISGTPTTPGAATFTVAVANSAGNTLTQNMTITISPPLSIGTPSLPMATAGMMYSQAINIIGGAMPYTVFTVTNFNAGTTGLTAGAITTVPAIGAFNINGLPTAAGVASFTINVTDSAGAAVTQDYTIIVNPAFVITPSLPQGTAGTNYQHTLTVTGGATPYSTLMVTGFTAGTTGLTAANITTDVGTGTFTINGTPTAAGTFSFVANVADAGGATLTKPYTVTINPALTITPALPQGTAGASYHQTITVAGGSKPYPTFTVTGFNAGATGLSPIAVTANPGSGTVVVNGTATAAGTVGFTVNVTDAAGSTLTKTYSITINPAITVGNLSATQWTAGMSGFPGTLTLTGGTGTLSIAATSGLPAGLTANRVGNSITFSGTPTSAGTFASGSVTIHDSAGASVTKTFSISIHAAPTIGNLTANQWTVGRPGFNGTLSLAGGTGSLIIVGSTGVPSGMSIVIQGSVLVFTGAAASSGTFNTSVTVHDAIGASITKTFSFTINAVPTVSNLTMTQWTKGQSGFNGALTVAAGTGPYTIASVSGLPTGLIAVIKGNTIRFAGAPTSVQTFASGSITIRDAAGATVIKNFSITINPPVLITTTSFPATTMALLYFTSVHATGGTGTITYALTAGSLPPGIKLSSTGAISGLSRGFGSFTFTITATDITGATFSEKYTLKLGLR